MSSASGSYLQRREALDKALELFRLSDTPRLKSTENSVDAVLADADRILKWMTTDDRESI